ncbi:MAG: DUF1311 domain-containing protein [Reyranella sp.]|nr:DUF1311 domain-containing protein [Reyranella sp.]
MRDFIPIRIVTELEVFARAWIKELIDHGTPYAEHAATLAKDVGIKFDYAVSQALIGQRFSLGDLVSHSVSVNSFDQLIGNFNKLLGHDFLPSLKDVHDRWSVELHGKPKTPIIEDMDAMCRHLSRLFEVRHVVVHEKPSVPVFSEGDIASFFSAAQMLIQATNERFTFLRHGLYPLTQMDMNIEAGQRYLNTKGRLAQVLAKFDKSTMPDFDAAQEAWEAYIEAHASAVSGFGKPGAGSMASMVYSSIKQQLTDRRMKDLEELLEEMRSR